MTTRLNNNFPHVLIILIKTVCFPLLMLDAVVIAVYYFVAFYDNMICVDWLVCGIYLASSANISPVRIIPRNKK